MTLHRSQFNPTLHSYYWLNICTIIDYSDRDVIFHLYPPWRCSVIDKYIFHRYNCNWNRIKLLQNRLSANWLNSGRNLVKIVCHFFGQRHYVKHWKHLVSECMFRYICFMKKIKKITEDKKPLSFAYPLVFLLNCSF